MKNSYLLLHIGVVLLGFSGIFGKLISLNEGLLTWYRVFFSAVILFFVLRFFKIEKKVSFTEKWKMAKVGLLITVSWILFYASIKYSNVSIGVVCFCLASFYTAVFSPMINKTRFKGTELFLSGLTLIGVGLIFHFDTSYRVGIILGIISPAFTSLYTIYNEQLVRKYDSKLLNYYQMVGGTIGLGVFLPVYLYYFPQESLIPDWKDFLYLILLAAFCTVFMYVSFAEVLKKIPAFTVNLSLNLEPVYAIVLAFWIFGESKEVNLSFYVGLLFVIVSVVLQTFISIRASK